MLCVTIFLVALVCTFAVIPAQGQFCFPVASISVGLVNYAACSLQLSTLEPLAKELQFTDINLYNSWMIVRNMEVTEFKVERSGCKASALGDRSGDYQVNLSAVSIKVTADVQTKWGRHKRGKLEVYDPSSTANIVFGIGEVNGCAVPNLISCTANHDNLKLRFKHSSMKRLGRYILPAIQAQLSRKACEVVQNLL